MPGPHNRPLKASSFGQKNKTPSLHEKRGLVIIHPWFPLVGSQGTDTIINKRNVKIIPRYDNCQGISGEAGAPFSGRNLVYFFFTSFNKNHDTDLKKSLESIIGAMIYERGLCKPV